MPGRSYTAIGAGKYRYGFNGKERDDEGLGGGQSTYDYGFRIYNPSLCRFLSVDPLFSGFPFYTPYQFAGNKPIVATDLDGLEEYIVHNYYNESGRLTKIQISSYTDIKGKVRDADVKRGTADLTTQKVWIQNHYPDGTITEGFADALTKSQRSIMNKRFKKRESHLTKGTGGRYGGGNDVGKTFNDGDFNLYERIIPPKILQIDYEGSSDKIKVDKLSEAKNQIKELAEYLAANPDASVTLVGNTGGKKEVPEGKSEEVYKAAGKLNGKASTVGALMLARAETIKTILVNEYKIDPSRITTKKGEHSHDESKRNVSINIAEGK
jgi:RHS repeat-associated protein